MFSQAWQEEADEDTLPADAPYLARLRERTPILPDDEVRALWVVRDALTTPESVTRLVDFAVQTRTHLLFVQVRGRADAWYRSSIDPLTPLLTAPLTDFDPLAYLISLARREGIAVHAWLNVFYVWSNPNESPPPAHLVAKHPDWLLTDAKGVRMDRVPASRWNREGIEGWFVSPAVPEMRRHMAAVVRELIAAYPLDGIHLDYIRYPNRAYSFNPRGRAEFALRWGLDPVEFAAGDRGTASRLIGDPALGTADSLYSLDRVAQVDSMVVAIRDACGSVPLSAAVVADPFEARHEKGQDWASWVHRGWVDFVVPMAYNMPPLELEHRAEVYHRTIGRDRLLIGLGVFAGRDEYLADAVTALRAAGVAGFAIFSYNVLAEDPFSAALIEHAVLPPDTTGEEDEDESPDSDEEESEDEEDEE